MKQAILITAYKDPGRLRELIDIFGDGAFEFYIHVDKKSGISDQECLEIAHDPRVAFFSRRYAVNWGGMNHLKAILLLAGQVVRRKDIGYVHLISGCDYPVKSPFCFKEFAQGNRVEYLENFPVPTPRWHQGGMNRVERYYFMDLFDTRNPRQGKMYDWVLWLQEKCGVRRSFSPKLPSLYGGSTWWSLTHDCVKYVVDYTAAHPRLLRRLRNTFIPEEFYFQTVIMNSPFAERVEDDNRRYIDWNFRNGNCPAVLDITDVEAIRSSSALFARKVEPPASCGLMECLRQRERAVI